MRRTISNGTLTVFLITLAGCGDDAGSAKLAVEITSPTSTVYTRQTVTIQAIVTGGTADRLELLRDGEALVTLAMPYQYAWDTSTEDEGEHAVVARAYRGDDAVDSDPRVVVVDRTAPTVASHSPAVGDENVGVHQPIRVGFSEPIHPDSVRETAVTMTGDAGVVPTTPSLSVDGLTLTVTPGTALAAPDVVTVALSAELTDLAGNPLTLEADPWTFSFPEWLHLGDPLDAIPDGDSDARDAIVRLGADDQPVVAWGEDAPGVSGRSIQIAAWSAGEWVPYAEMNAQPAADLAMALDGAGTPILAWGHYAVSDTLLRVQAWSGTDWRQLGGDLDAWTLSPAETPTVAVDSSGASVVAWSEYSSTADARNVYVRRWNGDAWDSIGTSVSASALASTDAILPELAIGPSDWILLTWAERIGGELDVFVAEWTGSTWRLLGGGGLGVIASADARDPTLVFAGATPLVAWSEGDEVRVKRWGGTSWASLDPLTDADPLLSPRDPTLAIDPTGAPVVAWTEWHATASKVLAYRYEADSWSPLASGTVGFYGTTFVERPSLAIAPSGDVFLGLNDRSGDPRVHVLRLNQ